MIGIDPTTGAQKFSITMESGAKPLAGPIVAGDGNAYVAYATYDGAVYDPTVMLETLVGHLKLLQVSSAGSSAVIPIQDFSLPSWPPVYEENLFADLITNADTGVVVTWEFQEGLAPEDRTPQAPVTRTRGVLRNRMSSKLLERAASQPVQLNFNLSSSPYGMAITNGTGITLMNGPVVPGQLSNVVPIVQNEDGSFTGIVVTGTPDNPEIDMVAFDEGGGVRWVAPNDQPQIATAEGGVIGQSGVTYDANGNATGVGPLYTQSWTYNLYQDGQVTQVFATPTLLATSWAFQPQTTAAKPLPDSVKAITDVGSSNLREIDYYPFQGNIPWQNDPYNPAATITEYRGYISGVWPPKGCNAADFDPNNMEATFCGTGNKHFDDLISNSFVRTQKIFVNLPRRRRYQVWIYPCTAQNKFGNQVYENQLSAPTNASISVNGDTGSTTLRTCSQ